MHACCCCYVMESVWGTKRGCKPRQVNSKRKGKDAKKRKGKGAPAGKGKAGGGKPAGKNRRR